MSHTIRSLAVRNIRRRAFRTFALIFAIAIATSALFSSTVLSNTIERTLDVGIKRLGADLVVAPAGYEASTRVALIAGEPQLFYMDKSIEEKVASIRGVERVTSQLFMTTSAYTCCWFRQVFLVAFDPKTDFTVQPWLKDKLNRPFKNGDVICGCELPLYKGYNALIYGEYFTVYGVLEKTGIGFFDKAMFISYKDAYKLIEETKRSPKIAPLRIEEGKISIVLVKAKPNTDLEDLKFRIESSIPGVSVITTQQILLNIRQQLLALFGGALAISGAMWVANTLMIFAIFSTIIRERQREYGILRAIGATKFSISKLIIYEAVLITVIGAIVGIFASGIFFALFKDVLLASLAAVKLPYMWPDPISLIVVSILCIGIAVGSGIIGALNPALIASKIEPYDAIRLGE